VNQTVNVPGTPVVETIQVGCSFDPNTSTENITVYVNGAPAASANVFWPGSVSLLCPSTPVTIGTMAETDTIDAYISQPFGTVCAISVGGACEVVYPFNPMTDTLHVHICQGTSCSQEATIPLSTLFELIGAPTPQLPTVNIP
jgi:hypothetical protein